MLVLSRRVREKIYFPALNVTVQVVGVTHGRVRLAIEAPPDVTVLRDELRGRGRNRDAANGLVAPPRQA
jgi:carbon storage regulator CsrA